MSYTHILYQQLIHNVSNQHSSLTSQLGFQVQKCTSPKQKLPASGLWPGAMYNHYIRLQKINCMSQSCRTRFWCTFDSAKFKLFNFFFSLPLFFSSFLWTFLSKYTWKNMTETIKHFGQQTSSTLCSVLYLVHQKIKFHISYWPNLWLTQIWHVCCSGKKNV